MCADYHGDCSVETPADRNGIRSIPSEGERRGMGGERGRSNLEEEPPQGWASLQRNRKIERTRKCVMMRI